MCDERDASKDEPGVRAALPIFSVGSGHREGMGTRNNANEPSFGTGKSRLTQGLGQMSTPLRAWPRGLCAWRGQASPGCER